MIVVSRLFDQDESGGRVVAVAVSAGVWRTFDYLWPEALGAPQRGVRVRVPFGRGDRKTLGFVADCDGGRSDRQLKTVAEVIDPAPQLDENLWRLGEWMAGYYLAPLGMTLAAMVPSAVGRHAPRMETAASLATEPADWPGNLGPRQKRVLDELLEARKQGVGPLTLERLRAHAGASGDSIRRLAARGLICLQTTAQRLEEAPEGIEPDPFELNDDQQRVLDALQGRLAGGFSATVLHGVTGSGKTEVYIRAIRQVVKAGRQAILLAPEIALATQTLQRLARRLPRVAVLHSHLTGAQRAFYYAMIRDGRADVVIGPRSAIFAPARRLGLIVVDEEHEGSYKQDTVPRYHGRDVAVKRGALEGVPVILGSATPSLESIHNARAGRYNLLELPRRIRGLPLPKLTLVELRKDITPGRIELIGRTLQARLAETLDKSEQAILLMNRRGYASYVFCASCGWRLECDACTRSLVFHQALRLAMCHYCQATAEVPRLCPACGKKIILFGLGIQRIESELARKFPNAAVARMDSDTMTSAAQFRKVFDGVAGGEIDILLGTQMVAKGLDFPRVSLVGVVSADTALAIPDFRAAERTFQLIVQVAGRAGRSDVGGNVVVQTIHPDDPAIRLALDHNYAGFVAGELPRRQAVGVSPFARLVRFIVRHTHADRAADAAETLGRRLHDLFGRDRDVRLVGPMRAGVFKIRGRFRFQLNLWCPRAGHLQEVLAPRMDELGAQLRAEIVADADPINLL